MSVRRNYCTNPSMETGAADALATGWGISKTVTGVPVFSKPAGRERGVAQRIQHTGAAESNKSIVTHLVTENGSFAAGEYCTASAYMKGGNSGIGTKVWVYFLNDAGAVVASAIGTSITLTGEWQRSSLKSLIAPANTSKVEMDFQMIGIDEGEVLDLTIDDVLIEKSAVLTPYFDGSFPYCSWEGAANASTSVKDVGAGVTQPRVVPGAVLELHAARAAGGLTPGINDPLTDEWFDTSGNGNHGTLTNFGYPAATNYCSVNPSSVGAKWGTNGAGQTWTLEANPPVQLPAPFTSCTKLVQTADTTYPYYDNAPKFAVAANEVFTFSMYVHLSDLSASGGIFLGFYTYIGTTIVRNFITAVQVAAVNSSFVRVSGTITIAASGEDGLRVLVAGGAGTVTAYLTGAMLEKSAVLTPYFDGSTHDCSWSSTPNASTSLRPAGWIDIDGHTPWAGTGTPADPYRLVFDGADDCVSLPDLSAAEDWAFSYEAWFKTTAAAGDLITEGNTGTDTDHSRLAVTGGRLRASIRGSAGTNYLTDGAVTVNDGALRHAVVTCGANLEQIYADGAPDGTPLATVTSALATNQTTIGALRGIATLYYFPGSILAARVYPFALTAAQVAQNYNAGPGWAGRWFRRKGRNGQPDRVMRMKG